MLQQNASLNLTPNGFSRSLRGAFWRSIQPISLNIISLPAMALIIRKLGPAGYGTWITATSLVAVVTPLTSLGLRGAFIRGVAQNPATAPQALADQLGLRIILALFALTAAILAPFFLGYNSVVAQCTAIAAAGMLITAVASTASDLLESQQRLPITAAAAMIAGLLLTAASVIAVWLGAGPVALSLAYLIGPLASLWVFAKVFRRDHFPIKAHFQPRRALRLLWHSRHFTAQKILTNINNNVALLMLPKLVGATSFGIFSAGALLISRAIVFPDSMATALYPLVSKSIQVDRRLARRNALMGIASAFIACVCVAAPTTLLAPFIARILFPKQPAECAHVIALTIWALPLIAIELTLGYSLNAAGKEAAQARGTLWSSLISVAIGAILVLHWNLEGACWFMLIRPALLIAFIAPQLAQAFADEQPPLNMTSEPLRAAA